jgi:hypothetical protein
LIFTSSDPAILSADVAGQFTAVAPGFTLANVLYTPPGIDSHPLEISALVSVASADDRDADGMPNLWELGFALNADNPADADLDADGDGASNLQEYTRATDTAQSRHRRRRASDGIEINNGEDPLLWPELDNNWQVTIAGQLVPVNPDGSFSVANISAPDTFGAGGPGTPPDFVSDDFVRVIGQRDYYGSMIYAFSEPFQIRSGRSFIVPATHLYACRATSA